MDYREFIKSAAHVKPSKRQLDWYNMGMYAFVHFSMNTYTHEEVCTGDHPVELFNPTDLDCDQWVEAVKAAGFKGIVLTAKHHAGFCLWQTKTTEYCIRNSPWKNGKGDIVRECAEACKRGGIKFGVYIATWDRNSPKYGTDEFADFYCEQLTELLTGYGELFTVWFDGACLEGPNGKKQEHPFHRYIELIRKYQPNAVIFNDHGPDIRWCGNEAGIPRRAEWAVVPHDLCHRCEKQTGDGPLASEGSLEYMYNPEECIGDLNVIQYAHGLAFCGAEIDMSIRKGWFWHPEEEPHSLERLMNTYINSVGANTCLNLNIPPMENGKFCEKDIARLKEFGEAIEAAFGEAKKANIKCELLTDAQTTQPKIRVKLDGKTKIKYIELRENIAEGQRVELFRIMNGSRAIYKGYTIGNRKICPVNAETDSIDIEVLSARDAVDFKDIIVYKA